MAGMEPLSDKTVGEIDALAKQISVAHRLDAEIQAELRGHVEDKVRGYVSGEVRPSEADALLLAKAHFGETGVIQRMFHNVHTTVYAPSLVRRMVAAFVLSVWVWSTRPFAESFEAWLTFRGSVVTVKNELVGSHSAALIIGGLVLVAMIAAEWGVLAYWRRRRELGKRLWFERWSPFTLGAIVVCSLLCYSAITDFCLTHSLAMRVQGTGMRWVFVDDVSWQVVYGWIYPLSLFAAEVLLWIWWCDGRQRTARQFMLMSLTWVPANLLLLIFSSAAGSFVYLLENPIGAMHARLYNILKPWMLTNIAVDLPMILMIAGAYFYVINKRWKSKMV